jgi:hypothetical protein
MTEAEWLAGDDPAAMLRWLLDEHQHQAPPTAGCAPSDRRLRLWVEACRAGVGPGLTPSLDLGTEYGLRAALEHWGTAAGGEYRDRLPPPARAALLRDIVGNPWRPSVVAHDGWKDPRSEAVADWKLGAKTVLWRSCVTPQVLSLARLAHDERAPDGTLDPLTLCALADALEEAGCVDQCEDCGGTRTRCEHTLCVECGGWIKPHPLPAHLRSPEPHVRGCWAVSLILGDP